MADGDCIEIRTARILDASALLTGPNGFGDRYQSGAPLEVMTRETRSVAADAIASHDGRRRCRAGRSLFFLTSDRDRAQKCNVTR
jgi:hypothetical protein